LVGVNKFQKPFPEENASGHQPQDENAARAVGWWMENPSEESVHLLLLSMHVTGATEVYSRGEKDFSRDQCDFGMRGCLFTEE
jgi:hypothetical protein